MEMSTQPIGVGGNLATWMVLNQTNYNLIDKISLIALFGCDLIYLILMIYLFHLFSYTFKISLWSDGYGKYIGINVGYILHYP